MGFVLKDQVDSDGNFDAALQAEHDAGSFGCSETVYYGCGTWSPTVNMNAYCEDGGVLDGDAAVQSCSCEAYCGLIGWEPGHQIAEVYLQGSDLMANDRDGILVIANE